MHGKVKPLPASCSKKIYICMEREFQDDLKYEIWCAPYVHFLVACTRLYISLCRSVGRSVGLSVCRSVGLSVCWSVASRFGSKAFSRLAEEYGWRRRRTRLTEKQKALQNRVRKRERVKKRNSVANR